MRITNCIYTLETASIQRRYGEMVCTTTAYAVIQPDGITLIDTGFPGHEEELLREAMKLEQQELPVKQILLTHADLDHMGNAAWLQEKTGCPVYLSPKEASYLTGARPRLPVKEEMCRLFGLRSPHYRFYPEDGVLGDFQVIPTPGHTAGHVCLLYHGVLFGGDAFSCFDGVLQTSKPQWTEDLEQAQRSLDALRACPCSILCPAHGAPTKRKNHWQEGT